MRTALGISGLFLLGGLAACGGGSGNGARGPAPTTTMTSTVTPTASAPAPAGTATPTTTAMPASATPTGAPIGTVVTGASSALVPPDAPTTKPVPAEQGQGCYGLQDAGFNYQDCTRFASPLGTAIAFAEVSGTMERDLVYTVTGSTARLALRATRTLPPSNNGGNESRNYSPDTTRVQASDLADDNTPKAVFYTPVDSSQTPTAYQSLDVVEADGKVVLHRNLHGGVARKAFGGGLETWTPVGGTRAEHAVFQYRGGAWRLTASGVVNSDTIPEGTGEF